MSPYLGLDCALCLECSCWPSELLLFFLQDSAPTVTSSLKFSNLFWQHQIFFHCLSSTLYITLLALDVYLQVPVFSTRLWTLKGKFGFS